MDLLTYRFVDLKMACSGIVKMACSGIVVFLGQDMVSEPSDKVEEDGIRGWRQ